MMRRGLLRAIRARMRSQAVVRDPPEVKPAPRRRPPGKARDAELERLEAEARYHKDRFDLYHARVVSGSSAPSDPSRLRELDVTARAAAERLAHARRSRGPA